MNDAATPGTRPAIDLAPLLRQLKGLAVEEYLNSATLRSLFDDLCAASNDEPQLETSDHGGSHSIDQVVGGVFNTAPIPAYLNAGSGRVANSDVGLAQSELLTLMWDYTEGVVGLAIEHPERGVYCCAWMRIAGDDSQRRDATVRYAAIGKKAVLEDNAQLLMLIKKRLDIVDD
ncbi:MAG: hypothetical protein HKM24_01485 [Gammaproteobacteria bacterium]|nr:hypothetical protein [Gammaproteobacteria bacterium]